MRYIPHPRPDDNPYYPWQVRDTLDDDRMGPGFSPRDAAIVAWALSHGEPLVRSHPDLAMLVRDTVATSLTSFQEATRLADGSQDPITRAYLEHMGLDPDGTV